MKKIFKILIVIAIISIILVLFINFYVIGIAKNKMIKDFTLFNKLKNHIGHDIEIAYYYDEHGEIVEICVECLDCNEVIISAESDGEEM